MYPNSEQIFEFHSFEASLISDCKRFSTDISTSLAAVGGLDFLVMTQGGIGKGERNETEEGHELYAVDHSYRGTLTRYRFLALQDFSRFIVATMLIPVLQQSGRGVVLDVLAAGVWNEFDLEDLELRTKSPNFFSEFNYLAT